MKWEYHTKHFVFNKKPYSSLKLQETERADIMDAYCSLIGNLDLMVVNLSIVKPQIQNPLYRVLDTALKYSIQRIENDLDPANNPQRR